MLTYRAGFGSRSTDNDMSAIAAFPNRYTGLFKYGFGFHIFKKSTVSFLMCFLNSGNATELLRQIVKAFFIGFSCHTIIHIRPLIIFAFCRCRQVFLCITNSC